MPDASALQAVERVSREAEAEADAYPALLAAIGGELGWSSGLWWAPEGDGAAERTTTAAAAPTSAARACAGWPTASRRSRACSPCRARQAPAPLRAELPVGDAPALDREARGMTS
jgi:hypothetical protein